MRNNSVPKFIFRLSRFPVYRGSVLGRFYCINLNISYCQRVSGMIRDRAALQKFPVVVLNPITNADLIPKFNTASYASHASLSILTLNYAVM